MKKQKNTKEMNQQNTAEPKKMSFEHKSRNIEFSVEYRKRRSLGIKIIASDDVRVFAPIRAREKEIIDLVRTKADWIIKKCDASEKVEKIRENLNLEDGAQILFRGKMLTIVFQPEYVSKKNYIYISEDKLVFAGKETGKDILRKIIQTWYKEKAKEYILERSEYFSDIIGVRASKFNVKEQKARWGSCSSTKSINFNWKIIMAPDNVIDYVVVHELCHIKHLNHSAQFWALVQKTMPDFKTWRTWLKKEGWRLYF